MALADVQRKAVKHGAYASPLMRPGDAAEVAEIVAILRAHSVTLDALDGLETCAVRIWRLRRH